MISFKYLTSPKSKSGYTGVVEHGDQWKAQLRVEGRKVYLGLYPSPEEAAQAVVRYKKSLREEKAAPRPKWEPPPLYAWIFGDDSILPSQYHESGSRLSGERGLLLAVLHEAIDTAQGKRLNEAGYTAKQIRETRAARLQHEAWEWIESEDESYLYTFCQCCYRLGIDPDWLRGKLKNATNSPLRTRQRIRG